VKALVAADVPRECIHLFCDDTLKALNEVKRPAFYEDGDRLVLDDGPELHMAEIEDMCCVHRGAWTAKQLAAAVKELFRGPTVLPGLNFVSIDHGFKTRDSQLRYGLRTPGTDDLGLMKEKLIELILWSDGAFEKPAFTLRPCTRTRLRSSRRSRNSLCNVVHRTLNDSGLGVG
jgi:hypothetical protein